jgi:hypothetical protein
MTSDTWVMLLLVLLVMLIGAMLLFGWQGDDS